MIKDIKELNFPSYATLSQATCTLQDMAEKFITTQVKIDGAITPDFSYDWAIEFKGEKYIMPLRQPQAAKENTSLNSTIDLTFQHWAQYQLKRWYFFTLQPVESGTAIADKYIASVSLNLGDFCKLFGQVLNYYYGDSITIDLNPKWEFAEEPVTVEISYSYLWDVLIKFYELWAVRWVIEPNGGSDKYVIKVGYPVSEVDHIFEYGYNGGLLKVERQVQDENIRNMLLGRGGEKNLPYRYFKDVDKNNDSFPADPDWIPELANIYFSELRGATFRSYIQGWKARHYNGTSAKDKAYAPWAWEKGYTDAKFDPVEYIKDDASIAKYGELMGGLENNEEIYPSIQGVVVDPYGRIDETVDIEQIESDDVEKSAENDAVISNILGGEYSYTANNVAKNAVVEKTFPKVSFEVPAGKSADLLVLNDVRVLKVRKKVRYGNKYEYVDQIYNLEGLADITSKDVKVYDAGTNEERSASGITAGSYYYIVSVKFENTCVDDDLNKTLDITVGIETPHIAISTLEKEQWTNTFDIWVKNIWGSEKKNDETDAQYVERVWRPILGDHEGSEAKVVFSTGMLSTSEDYEFVIAKGGIHYDTSKTLNGVPSHWRLTLGKSDADLESTGLYLPSTMRQGKPGDHFFFIGIDMPHQYVLWAEERLDDYKTDNLNEVKDIKPTWVVSLDKVRINNKQQGEAETLISQLHVGDSIRIADKRFILNEEGTTAAYETLYLQSITYTYNEPTSSSPALVPNVEIVLSDKYETIANPIATLSGQINALAKQVGAISNVEQIVRAVGDKLYLRKDGISDRSLSPTEFYSLVTGGSFRSGIVGGASWGIYKDANGNSVIEADRFKARQDFEVNNLIINQIIARGGMIIESAAQMEITRVEEAADGYICYFDQHGGSVANLFQVDDVAYCNRFTPENKELKFYKRRVTAVDVDNITLTKGYAPIELPDGTTDTGVNGDGVPEEGDIITQYGNYTNTARQYAKVRDIIGGGYERYLEGLDSVNDAGKEYYFVGKHDGQNPRWFIGYKDRNYAEWRDGNLYIKGNIEMGPDSTGLSSLPEFKEVQESADAANKAAEKINDLQIGGVNLIDDSTLSSIPNGWGSNSDKAILGDFQGYECLKCPGYGSGIYKRDPYNGLADGEIVTFSAWAYTNTKDCPVWIGVESSPQKRVSIQESNEWVRVVATMPYSSASSIVFYNMSTDNDTYVLFRNIQAECGNVVTAWRPSLNDQKKNSGTDLDFLRQIFPDGLINNTATVSQLLAVRDEDNDIVAGIYGGGVPELEANGFRDAAHRKLMIFAGADGIGKVATAGTRIYEDGTIITSKLESDAAKITAAEIKDSTLTDVKITGILKSPFHSWNGWETGIGGDDDEEEDLTNAYWYYDNLSCGYVHSSTWSEYALKWTPDQNGRIMTLANVKYQGSNAGYNIEIKTKNGGLFFENGQANNSLVIKKGEIVRILGYGEDNTFYGWVVLSRVLTNIADTVKPDILYEGIVENGTLVKYKSWDGQKPTVTRTSTGAYNVSLPTPINPSNYTVMLTGWSNVKSFGADKYFASLHSKASNAFVVYTAYSSTNYNGGFTFQVINTENWKS